jgi:rhodanese-related sulfurtransferase
VRVDCEDGARAAYLFGVPAGGELPAAAVRCAFVGNRVADVRSLVGPATVLCAGAEGDAVPCTTYAGAVPEEGMHLEHGALERFLGEHPGALLVDVREAREHAAGAPLLAGRMALNVPLSRLAGELPRWLHGEPRPLVFFCRSGNRSARAAQCLRQLGYAHAWHLAGGLALA